MSISDFRRKFRSYLIPTKKAVEMQEKYLDKPHKVLSACSGFDETKSIWYPIDILREYLNYVEKLGHDHGTPVSGIRFYYSAYPKGKESAKKPKNRLALTAFPTTKINSKGLSAKEKKLMKEYEPLNHESFFIQKVHKKKQARHLKTLKKNETIINQNTALGSGGPYPPPPSS